MRRTVALVLLVGTGTGVALSAAATALYAAGSSLAPRVALWGVVALFATPPLRLAAVAHGFARERRPRLALASLAVLTVLLVVGARAALGAL
ncbi:MAG TPA: DUF1634 domain-containing protein [Anaeromyxobacteraceae bacterium]|nr:DUF1634 domain-containing protein [Anaeromyxobacteraceae bacterium]